MSEPNPVRRYAHTHAEYRWTAAKIAAFLHALPATGSVAAAARSVGMSRQSAYRMRDRMDRQLGPAFGQVWDDGLRLARQQGHRARCDSSVQGDASCAR